jgi:hypothetical protein
MHVAIYARFYGIFSEGFVEILFLTAEKNQKLYFSTFLTKSFLVTIFLI